MLADQRAVLESAGRLSGELSLPQEWRGSLLDFIANLLPVWRDDPERRAAMAETRLTAQLCSLLNSATRRAKGWDFLQFRMEEPDEVRSGRAIDLVAAPSGEVIWLEGRRHSQYDPILPIECKRLPTPSSRERDEREYLHSRHGSRGGVQRFKAGDHGAAHNHAAVIAYLQTENIVAWHQRIAAWCAELTAEIEGWTEDDALHLNDHRATLGVARLSSTHARGRGLPAILLDHIWVQM